MVLLLLPTLGGTGFIFKPAELARREKMKKQTVFEIKFNGNVLERVHPEDPLRTFTVPNGVTKIAPWAFSGCENIRKVILPEGLTEIGECAFRECTHLREVVLPDTLREIGAGAFSRTPCLEKIHIPEGVVRVPKECFFHSGVEEVVLPGTLREIGVHAFACSDLRKVTIPDGVVLADGCFKGCGCMVVARVGKTCQIPFEGFDGCEDLREIILPEGLETLEAHALAGTAIRELKLPDSLQRIGDRCLEFSRKLESIRIPKGVRMGDAVFMDCIALREVILPEDLEVLPERTFWCCEALESIHLPDSVREVEDGAFTGCVVLRDFQAPKGCDVSPAALDDTPLEYLWEDYI